MKSHTASLTAREAQWHQVSAEDALAHGVLARRRTSPVITGERVAQHPYDPALRACGTVRVFRGIRYGLLGSLALWAAVFALVSLFG